LYRKGEICTSQALGIEAKKVFSADKFEDVLEYLTEPLLTSAYTQQPFDLSSLKRKLQENDTRKIFEGFFKDGAKTSAVDACKNFGSALALCRTPASERFDPVENNEMFRLIREKLDESTEGVQTWKIYRDLEKPPYGVRKDITTLYLLSFVRANTNTELWLKSSAAQHMKKINSFNIGEVEWRSGIEDDFNTLIKSAEIIWNDVLPYARKISTELRIAHKPEEIKEQERELIEKLSTNRERSEKAGLNLGALSGTFGEDTSEHMAALGRLKKLCEAGDYRQFYVLVDEIYSKDEKS